MKAIRLHEAGELVLEDVADPVPRAGEALVTVQAAAITRGELEWPADRLPAIPSYELAGKVAAVGDGVDAALVGEEVFAMTPFDRDGAAAELIALPADLLAPAPRSLDPAERAALPLPALSAWQGLFTHGRLVEGERILITGAGGGVGHLASQLATARGAELVDRDADLVFDTAGGERLRGAAAALRDGGRLVSVAEEPPDGGGTYFVVEPDREQLTEISRLAERGELRPEIDSVFDLEDAAAAFERAHARGKRGKVVLLVAAP